MAKKLKILLTGATGYIGSRLLLLLLEEGHELHVLVRHPTAFLLKEHPHLHLIDANLTDLSSLEKIPSEIDIAYYLVHSMSDSKKDFVALEETMANNFIDRMRKTTIQQLVYLSGLVSDQNLSPHLKSRLHTEEIFKQSGLPYTILRAGIIIGSGSASFEIIRDLVDKLPIMVAPRWVNNLCQPIAVRDVLRYLMQIMQHPSCINQVFDIGGPDQLNYKAMLLGYAKIRGLKRSIFVLPVLTPKLSSYWLYFVTSVNFSLASSLVDSVKNEAICKETRIQLLFTERCLSYLESIRLALDVVEQNPLLPGWKDSLIPDTLEAKLSSLMQVPTYGCLKDEKQIDSPKTSTELIERIWSIGGDQGWYYMDWAWTLRGFFDKLVGGTGLNRGRTHPSELYAGSSLDFWRVLVADKNAGRLLLYAEMKVPGEAWLEFKVQTTPHGSKLIQIASFRPKGLLGRAYWYLLLPIHKLIFRGMATSIACSP